MKSITKFRALLLLFVGVTMIFSCENEYELPETGSQEDMTPPEASFSASEDPNQFNRFLFGNTSTSATTFAWDYGDGNSSMTLDGENVYAAEGVYTVTLTATDALGATSTFSSDIEVIEPEAPSAIVPTIQAPGFENGVDYPCSNRQDARDCWRSNSDFGGILQQTTDPVRSGARAGKFPGSDDRIGYQDGIVLSPNTDYELVYYYTLKAGGAANLTVSIIEDGTYATLADAEAATIASFAGTDQSDPNSYTRAAITFNSGANNAIGILINKTGPVEGRMDDFSLQPLQ